MNWSRVGRAADVMLELTARNRGDRRICVATLKRCGHSGIAQRFRSKIEAELVLGEEVSTKDAFPDTQVRAHKKFMITGKSAKIDWKASNARSGNRVTSDG